MSCVSSIVPLSLRRWTAFSSPTPNLCPCPIDRLVRLRPPDRPQAATSSAKSSRSNSGEEDFAARRLSVHNPFDEDWNDVEEEEGEPSETAGN